MHDCLIIVHTSHRKERIILFNSNILRILYVWENPSNLDIDEYALRSFCFPLIDGFPFGSLGFPLKYNVGY